MKTKTSLSVSPVSPVNSEPAERDRLLAEGLVVAAPAGSPATESAAAARHADLGTSLVDLIAGLADRLGPGYSLRLSGSIEVTPNAYVMGGGGPPLNANGGPLIALPERPGYRYANNTGATMWLFVAGTAFTLSPSLPSTVIHPIDAFLAQAQCGGVALHPAQTVPPGVTGSACRVLTGAHVDMAWAAGSTPRAWVRGLRLDEVLPPPTGGRQQTQVLP